jgi:hypothetical protein
MILVMLIWPFGSGGKEYHMIADNGVPAAHGTLQVKRDTSNANTQLDVKVWDLANPRQLTPPENVYVVWVRPRNGVVEKEGALQVGNDLKAELKATTTATDADVFITGETDETVSSPSGPEVLHTHISP